MSKSKKVKAFKILLGIIVIAIIIAAIMYFFPVVKDLSSVEGQVAFQNKFKNSGIGGILALLGLQIAQIFLVIIPGEPIEILAGMCYGGLWGTIFIMASCFFISGAIFLLVRKFGKRFVYAFCEPKNIEKIENSKLFQNPKEIEWIMFILFLIPGTPKDLLVYIAGLLPIKPIRFLLIATFARFPSVITSTLVGDNILKRRLANRSFIICWNRSNSVSNCNYY